MTFDLVQIWAHMGILAKSIAFILFMMAVASVGVVVERFINFFVSAKATRAFAQEAGPAIKHWNLDELSKASDKHKKSPLAFIFGKMVGSYKRGQSIGGELSPKALAQGEAERRLEATGADLRRGMNVLASVGSVAPFVGLLGTVVGIIGAFQGIGEAGNAGLSVVMAGISEALIETAFGLMVAIPAVLFFNYLSSRVSALELALTQSVGELLDEMENRHGHQPQSGFEKAA